MIIIVFDLKNFYFLNSGNIRLAAKELKKCIKNNEKNNFSLENNPTKD